MTGTDKAELDRLEIERRKIVGRINEIREAEDNERAEALVGSFFKYKNSYSADEAHWWIWRKVFSVLGEVRYVDFQVDPKGRCDIDGGELYPPRMLGWVAVSPGEYENARRKFVALIATVLSP